MTKTVTMRVGRKCNPDKMRRYNLALEPALIIAMKRKAQTGKVSAWVRAILWEAVNR
jgi:hypothetical protein